MATLGHIYVTAHGEWTATKWVGEKGQIGIRLPIVDNDAEPAVGSIFTPIANGDVVLESGTETGANGTLQKTWTARLGLVGSTNNADAAYQIDLAEDFRTFLNSAKDYNSPGWRWTHVKIAPVAVGGDYAAPSAIYQFTSPIVGAATGATTLPPEVALALSLRAPVIGRRGRGRMYFPALTSLSAVAVDGTVQPGHATALRGFVKTLVTDLNDNPGTEDYGTIVAVMSANSTTAVRPAEVRVGDHFDVQRRRQHQVAETFSTEAL